MGSLFQLCVGFNFNASNHLHAQATTTNCKFSPQSVRALPIRILSVGKKRSQGLQLMVDEYVEKIKYYCSVEDVQIRPNPRNARDPRAQVDDEDMAVMNIIRSDDWVVMLDEHGQDVRSEQMAELMADAGNTRLHGYTGNYTK
ncbi:putative RNA methyltransferase At5g10620 isoform X2 [Vicia villosa]|uniref:putative RNA methyltransferase At5g10620 isoform X2 n=1 Tax=Vicia villosa TaxID=3911 RepID=UPI00273C2AC8|nr:putative RNA methyltransferase At5g10620 isoform X2 [Vicia villosa]